MSLLQESCSGERAGTEGVESERLGRDPVKKKPWWCTGCFRHYRRPRRILRGGGMVRGQCWNCNGYMHRVILPIEGSVFSGESLVHRMLREAREPGPRDWSPRGKVGIKR